MKDVQSNPCTTCPGHCCSRNVINVCGYDAWAIARGLGIDPMDFLAFARLEEQTPYNFRLDGSGTSYHLALNMNLYPDGARRCIFGLALPRGQFRCGIYELRPIGCRNYPFTFGNEGPAFKPWALCPQTKWTMDHPDLDALREQLARSDMEFCIYRLVVSVWNESMVNRPSLEKLDFRPFVRYVIETYDRLDVPREEIPPEAWAEIWNRWRDYTAKGINPLELYPIPSDSPPVWGQWLESIRQVVEPTPLNGNPKTHPVGPG